MTRYIDMTPTWPQAARIIAAALENGTDTGRDAARAELFRMAEILEALKDQQTAEQKPERVALWEVIAEPHVGQPFGQTFHKEADATTYAQAMQRAGYRVDLSPVFDTQPSAAAALKAAAEFFRHPELARERQP